MFIFTHSHSTLRFWRESARCSFNTVGRKKSNEKVFTVESASPSYVFNNIFRLAEAAPKLCNVRMIAAESLLKVYKPALRHKRVH